MRLPVAAWLPRYGASRLRGDGIGALTAWAIVVPESVAYAQIAGVPPQNAFYAAPVALVAYALFGSSRHLVVGRPRRRRSCRPPPWPRCHPTRAGRSRCHPPWRSSPA